MTQSACHLEDLLEERARRPGPWAPPRDLGELVARIMVALMEVGEAEGVQLVRGPGGAEFYGEEHAHLPHALNVGRRVPADVWARACHLALFGRPTPPSEPAADEGKKPRGGGAE